MPINPFQNPTDEQISAACHDGEETVRRDRANPYILPGAALNRLAWAWDLGRRAREYVDAERRELLEANRRAEVAATIARAEAKRGWPFVRGDAWTQKEMGGHGDAGRGRISFSKPVPMIGAEESG
jgi:hypothetical protein